MSPPLLIQGMHGLGDCIHQRAVIRHYLAQGRHVWLETSWPVVYRDLECSNLHFVRRPVNLRTQSKNAARELKAFGGPAPRNAEILRVMYHGADVMRTETKTVLESMCRITRTPYPADYRFPDPLFPDWQQKANDALTKAGNYDGSKPLLVYRPLVARPEWKGSMARNANELCYAHLVGFLRNHFYTVSVADLVPGQEWMVGYDLKADLKLHAGELDFEALAGMFALADLVVTSSGFAAILAPAVGTPCINIVGGYEDARAHDSGSLWAPFLSIEPNTPCRCWSSACAQQCTKEIDMIPAIDKIGAFCKEHFGLNVIPLKGLFSDMFEPERLTGSPPVARPGTVFRRPPHPNSPAYRTYMQMVGQAQGKA